MSRTRMLRTILITVLLLVGQWSDIAFAQSFSATAIDPVSYGLDPSYREAPSLRSPSSLIFLKPSGDFVTVSAMRDIFTRDAEGAFVPIDDRGVVTSQGIRFDRLPHDVRIVFDPEQPAYRYEMGQHHFELRYAASAPAVLESPQIVAYKLAEHVTLRFRVHGTSVSKWITIDGPFDPTLIRFVIEEGPGLRQHLASGRIELRDDENNVVFESESPVLQNTDGEAINRPIMLENLGRGIYRYSYDPAGLPAAYVIDPNTDARHPSTVQNSAYGTEIWINPENVASNTESTVFLNSNTSQYIMGTNFHFSIPDPDATINGIKVTVHRTRAESPMTQDASARLVKNSLVVGSDYAITDLWGGAEDVVYGGFSDLWGTSWSASDINASGFGFALAVTNGGEVDPNKLVGISAITIQVSGTLSDTYILNSIPAFGCAYGDLACRTRCALMSVEHPGCYCTCCGGGLTAPSGISIVDANDENTDMSLLANQNGVRTVRFKKVSDGTRIADVGVNFSCAGTCGGVEVTADADAAAKKSLIHGLESDITAVNGSGYTLYVPKSASHDQVRVCVGKTTIGCTASDTWSFLANDQGTIVATNGGFNTAGITVDVSGGYWRITGLKSTGGEGQDSGAGGFAVPEFSAGGLLLLLIGGMFHIRRMRSPSAEKISR